MFRKVSVFVLVVVFHLGVLGVVYLSTREPVEDAGKEVVDAKQTENKEVPSTESQNNGREISSLKPKTAPIKPTLVSSEKVHIVVQGDYLGKIASKYKVSAKDIMTLNKISNPNRIQPGQKIKIPAK